MSAGLALSAQEPAAETARGFHQTWYPLGLSTELEAGQVIGRDFLGTRAVLYRDPAGKVVVQSAWCPHLGADLSVGQLVDGQLRCAFHHWRYDAGGACVHIPTGDKIPPGARIATYPSAEGWGLIWAFNGETPRFGLPRIPGVDERDLVIEAYRRGPRNIDPWVAAANGVDFQHLRALHGLPAVLSPETVSVDDHSMEYDVTRPGYIHKGRINGPNCYTTHLGGDGKDMFMLFAGCAVAPGKSMAYYVIGVRKSLPPAKHRPALRKVKERIDQIYVEDAPVLDNLHFRKGVLVASDRHLARFFKFVDEFPRAEPLGA